MGTPEIAVASLEALLEDGQEVAAVITAPDKPSGRGRKIQPGAVKQFALDRGLKVLQPENLKSPDFLNIISAIEADLIVVVAFRMLPEEIWSLPPRGTINLHASMLPQYRGAAPINRAIMNGESETGVSTFFIEKDIDTGKVILQEPVPIHPDDNAGKLHDRIMEAGAELLVRTVHSIKDGNPPSTDQSRMLEPGEELKTAPKIFKEDCRINWDQPADLIHDHVRGLSPLPTAWTILVTPDGKEKLMKVYASAKLERDSVFPARTLLTDGKSRIEVVCQRGILNLTEVQLEGKRKMDAAEFLRGIPDFTSCKFK
jgi:methionyl-tRNA formyltransferase